MTGVYDLRPERPRRLHRLSFGLLPRLSATVSPLRAISAARSRRSRRLCLLGIALDRDGAAHRKSVYAKSQKRAFSQKPQKHRHNLRVRAASRR
jgi:hypothetical protein